ncbi:MAG: ABC transporter ATP-binding protein [Gemmatimonadales bacterium]
MIVAADSVSVRYRGAEADAVSGVSFAVTAGEMVAIGGPNGCGKTTMLRALQGLVVPTSGQVLLDGRPVASWTRRQVAQLIGALPQREEPAFPMRVEDAVALGRWAHLGAFAAPGARDHDAIDAAIARCDIESLRQRRIDTLSGGEWQRVRLARTLAAQPRALLLDEPTSALDVGHEMALFELMRDLADTGIAVVVVTHHLNVAARFADRMVLMQHGRVTREGPPRAAMTSELLSDLFSWPVRITTLPDGVPQFVAERDPERADHG